MALSYVNFGVVGWCWVNFHDLGVIWITVGQVNNAPAAGAIKSVFGHISLIENSGPI